MQTFSQLTIALLFASSAFAQQPAGVERVFHFTSTASPERFNQITTVIRSITDISQATIDAPEKSLTLRGSGSQIALAEWLFTNLDKSTNEQSLQNQNWARHEYRPSDDADDIVRLFYLRNPEVPGGVQEIATCVRSLADIRRLFLYEDLRAIAVRGTAEQIRLAEFLFDEMDKPAIVQGPSQKLESSASPEFRMAAPQENLVRVFYVPNTTTVRDFQEVATLVRTITDARRMFTYNAPRMIGVRGNGEQLALAAWLFAELDKASIAGARPDSAAHEYRLSPASDDLVRVFYLPPASSQHLQQTATQVRSRTECRRVFTYNAPSAVAIRGTAQQIALADRLIQDQNK